MDPKLVEELEAELAAHATALEKAVALAETQAARIADLEAQLAKCHKTLTICDGAMMGKVKPSSVAFKMIREIMYPESTWIVDESADGKPDGQEENAKAMASPPLTTKNDEQSRD